MIGRKFGRLLVTEEIDSLSYVQPNGKNRKIRLFSCVCDCGVIKAYRRDVLVSNKTKSCGCLRIDTNISRLEDPTGQTFNRLTVRSRDPVSYNCICECECGNTVEVKIAHLKNGNTKSCGCLQKEKASISIMKRHHTLRVLSGRNANEPLTEESEIQRQVFRETVLKDILKRDNYCCVWCSKQGVKFNVHHIDTWASTPERRFDKTNVVTLCRECHMKVHNSSFSAPVDPVMSILLQGYASNIEDYTIWCARIPVTPN